MEATPSTPIAAPDAGAEPRCSRAVLKLVADYWVLRIVEELSLAPDGVRFSSLQRSLGGASPATLTNRLRTLTSEQLLIREVGCDRQAITYRLSERGRRLVPVLSSIQDFAAEG
jgi:DNA-binding HxlR family transcriptional regulator